MNNMLNVFAILLVATFLFLGTLNLMVENIEDFETVPLPPKKVETITSVHPLLKIDATSKETWTLVNFSTGKTSIIKEPDEQLEKLKTIPWDLGFQRTKIISNSGVTNPTGQVGVINLGRVDFDSVAEAPETGYLNDIRSFGKKINRGISDWYNYRTRTHNIESKKNVYVVRASQGQYIKMRILNYYCQKKESDCRTMMCRRSEAACLTIEYVSQPNGTRFFPAPPPKQMVQTSAEDSN